MLAPRIFVLPDPPLCGEAPASWRKAKRAEAEAMQRCALRAGIVMPLAGVPTELRRLSIAELIEMRDFIEAALRARGVASEHLTESAYALGAAGCGPGLPSLTGVGALLKRTKR